MSHSRYEEQQEEYSSLKESLEYLRDDIKTDSKNAALKRIDYIMETFFK